MQIGFLQQPDAMLGRYGSAKFADGRIDNVADRLARLDGRTDGKCHDVQVAVADMAVIDRE